MGHPNGEEHSRVPKGNRVHRMAAALIIVGSATVIVALAVDDITGVGTADDALILVLSKVIWDTAAVFV